MPHCISRRTLIAGGLALALVESAPAFSKSSVGCDVVVAGSGAGGFTAAIRAAESGAKVILLEANSWTGGASRIATGIFGCAGHPIQKALGFTTTPEDLYRVYISNAAATNTKADPEAARILADGAIPAADWLASLGVEWSTKKAQKFFLNVKEGHRLGELMIPALERKAKSLGVEIRTNARVEKILMDEEYGVGIDSDEIDLLSATLINERTPTCYGTDKRWANHLYPVFLTESFVKSKYMSTEMFLHLF